MCLFNWVNNRLTKFLIILLHKTFPTVLDTTTLLQIDPASVDITVQRTRVFPTHGSDLCNVYIWHYFPYDRHKQCVLTGSLWVKWSSTILTTGFRYSSGARFISSRPSPPHHLWGPPRLLCEKYSVFFMRGITRLGLDAEHSNSIHSWALEYVQHGAGASLWREPYVPR